MSLTKTTYSMIEGAPINLLDYGADGTGAVDDTAAVQAAIDACPEGYWIDGSGQTYRIDGTVTAAGETFKLRNANFITTTSYATQGNFLITSMLTMLQDIEVDGGRDTYKVGSETWQEFIVFAGYGSIEPSFTDFFRVTKLDAEATVHINNVNFANIFASSCVNVITYGTVFISNCSYRNIANKTFHVYHSADDGVTQAGRTFVENVYAENVGILPAAYKVDGVSKVFANSYAPQGSFNFIVSHGDFTLNNAICWNYASCGVTADRNRSFNASNVFIFNNSGRTFSNNPSGAFWLEACNTVNVSNLFVWVTDREARDIDFDSSLLELYCNAGSQSNFNNVVLLTDQTTAKVNKIIRGAMFGNPSVNISNFYCYGLAAAPDVAISFEPLPNSVIGHSITLTNGYLRDGSINADVPYAFVAENVTCYGQTTGGKVTISPTGNPGVTGAVLDVTVHNCRLAGEFNSNVNITGTLKVTNNKWINGGVACGTVSGTAQINDNAYIGGNVTITSGGSTVGIVNIINNSKIAGTTSLIAAKNARVSGNNTNERIEIKDVQTFEIVGNTAKTDVPAPCIWVNPNTTANVLAGVISSNNILIKTGTVGAGYVTIAGGVSGVIDANNNKLTVAWTA